jgi:hypothetical protein
VRQVERVFIVGCHRQKRRRYQRKNAVSTGSGESLTTDGHGFR